MKTGMKWHVGETRDGLITVRADDGRPICNAFFEDDARMIAALPELLASADRVLLMHDDQVFICGVDDAAMADQKLGMLRAAIAKAKGEQ
jgi:hypothetical protein